MPTGVPAIDAYLAAQQQNQEQTSRGLDQVGQVLGIKAALQKQQEQEAFRREVSDLGPTPSQEQVTAVASKYANPHDLLAIHQASLDRKQKTAEAALQFAQNLDVRQQALEQRRTEFEQRQVDAASRMAFDQWYKGESLRNQQAMRDLNTQLRLQGMEITRQGQQLQLERFNAQQRDAEEKTIEGQIGKTANRMKDVQPVWTAAQQLNSTLSRYTPDNIPGVGYAKSTALGQMALTQEGKDVQSSIKLFGNSILKAMSGQAVTAPEEIRNQAAMMADGRFSAQDFYVAWPRISAWVNDQVKLATAGLTPAAKERFLDRTGLKLDPISPRFLFENGKLRDSQAPEQQSPPAGYELVK